MANTKISALTDIVALALGDKVPVADASDLTQSKSATMTELLAFILSNLTSTCGVANSATASQTDTITHGLGRVPTIIRIYGMSTFTSNNSATPTPHSVGIWNSTGNRCLYQMFNATAITTTQVALTSTTFAIFLSTSNGNSISGVIQNVTSTSFDIVWTETGTSVAYPFLWEAM